MYKGVSANVDFYSGFVYQMLGIPEELFTPIFAISRITGWSAHRVEELINGDRIIRPAYRAVLPRRSYRKLGERARRTQRTDQNKSSGALQRCTRAFVLRACGLGIRRARGR